MEDPRAMSGMPQSMWNVNYAILLCAASFGVPLVVIFIILPSVRSRQVPKLLKNISLFLIGFLLLLATFSSSWLYSCTQFTAVQAPGDQPETVRIKIWSGIINLNITADILGLGNSILFQNVHWNLLDPCCFIGASRKALDEGWMWSLVSIAEHLGGSPMAWHDKFGKSLQLSATYCLPSMVLAIFLWIVAICVFQRVSITSEAILDLLAAILICTALLYSKMVNILGHNIPLGSGISLTLEYGWAWYLVLYEGIILASIMIILRINKHIKLFPALQNTSAAYPAEMKQDVITQDNKIIFRPIPACTVSTLTFVSPGTNLAELSTWSSLFTK